jgi:hypothetical protein
MLNQHMDSKRSNGGEECSPAHLRRQSEVNLRVSSASERTGRYEELADKGRTGEDIGCVGCCGRGGRGRREVAEDMTGDSVGSLMKSGQA